MTPRPAAALAAAAILAAALTAGCASTGPSPAASASAAASARASQSSVAAVQSAIASEVASQSAAANAPCTTNACIAQDAEQSLPGAVANDNSVITKATCYRKTVVHHAAAKAYTVECRAYYTDGTSVTGYANLLLDQNRITWEPTG